MPTSTIRGIFMPNPFTTVQGQLSTLLHIPAQDIHEELHEREVRRGRMRGSPHLLQIWLLAHIRPFCSSHPFSYIADERSLIERLVPVIPPPEHSFSEWRRFWRELTLARFLWVARWNPGGPMITGYPGIVGVPLLSHLGSTLIFPGRVIRQLGGLQDVPAEADRLPFRIHWADSTSTTPARFLQIREIRRQWDTCVIQRVLPTYSGALPTQLPPPTSSGALLPPVSLTSAATDDRARITALEGTINQMAANMAELLALLRGPNRASSSSTPPPGQGPTVDPAPGIPPAQVPENMDALAPPTLHTSVTQPLTNPYPPQPAPTAVPLPPAAFLTSDQFPPYSSLHPHAGLSYPAPPPINTTFHEPGTPAHAAQFASPTHFFPEADAEQERRLKRMEETIRALQANDARPDARYGGCSLFPGMRLPPNTNPSRSIIRLRRSRQQRPRNRTTPTRPRQLSPLNLGRRCREPLYRHNRTPPHRVHKSAPHNTDPADNSKVPWTYEGSIGSVEQQFGVMGITRSGRVYESPTAKDKGKAPAVEDGATPESSPFPSKNVTEEEAEAFMKIVKASEYKVVEQIAKSPAHISLLALLLGSEPHREALLRVLTAAQVPEGNAPRQDRGDDRETAVPYISIGDDENLLFHSFETISVIRDYGESGPSRADRMIGKILLRNNYIPGTGLGAHGQGINRPIEIEEYKHRRGLGFRPSCHEIIEARKGNHLHRLAAYYGRLNRGTSVPLLSHFFLEPSRIIGGTLDGPSSDSDDTPAASKTKSWTAGQLDLSLALLGCDCRRLPEDSQVPEIEESLRRLEDHQITSVEPTEEINVGIEEEPRTLKIGTALDPTQRTRMIDFLKEYQEVFAWSYADMPGLDPSIVEHFLPLDTEKFPPKRQQLRQQRASLLLRIKEEVVKQINAGFFEVCNYSEWVANIVPVEKKDGRVRVGGFLGRLNYIARFIANLTDKCQPLFRLLRKNAAMEWDHECQKAFDTIKAYLIQPPILVPPVPSRPLILYLTVRR
ncbi:hypothetical protein CRG98_006456 [Punica granatum]|uniref:G-patch domain-containing protein n=1 Tax=Punica granatum TaxID=22663 RepID=A0A2I0KXI5_PUNGR|nr:hypothetical protein CRG98_006456 [Punica granatum]